jgi:hypothetical protein
MSIAVAAADGVSPDNGEFTLDHPYVADVAGPFWASVQSWVHTDDPSAGAFHCWLEYTDPTGQTRTVDHSVISLSDPAAINQSQVMPVVRLSNVSNLKFKTERFGSAGSSLVSYRLMITMADECSIQTLGLTPVP